MCLTKEERLIWKTFQQHLQIYVTFLWSGSLLDYLSDGSSEPSSNPSSNPLFKPSSNRSPIPSSSEVLPPPPRKKDNRTEFSPASERYFIILFSDAPPKNYFFSDFLPYNEQMRCIFRKILFSPKDYFSRDKSIQSTSPKALFAC